MIRALWWKEYREQRAFWLAIAGLTGLLVLALRDGLWEATDEVMGPRDTTWVPIESHPQLEEIAADLEPPPRRDEDETRLDMNALIDVCIRDAGPPLDVAAGQGVVWSTGPDRKDDGGRTAGPLRRVDEVDWWVANGADLVFLVPRWPKR